MGQSLQQCFGLVGYLTQRQYLAWTCWLSNQWNTPDRSDHYLMAIATEIRRVLCKNPNKIQPKDFKIKFIVQSNKPKVAPLTKAQIAKINKDRWLAVVGANMKVVKVTAEN